MSLRYLPGAMLAAAILSAADNKKLVPMGDPTAGNERIDITATLILDREEIRKALGADLPIGVIAVKVRVKSASEDAIRIDLDDFTLVSHKDGQRSGPFSPTQLAGNSTLAIKTETTTVGTGPMTRNTGPAWGGIPGTMGRPRQMPGEGNTVGNGGAGSAEVASGVEAKGGGPGKESPLLVALREKVLKSEEIKDPVSGLLYFPLEGKQKPKDLTLVYKGVGGRLVLSFGK